MGKRAKGITTATFALPDWMKKELEKLAKRKMTHVSVLAREALLEYLTKNSIKQPR